MNIVLAFAYVIASLFVFYSAMLIGVATQTLSRARKNGVKDVTLITVLVGYALLSACAALGVFCVYRALDLAT